MVMSNIWYPGLLRSFAPVGNAQSNRSTKRVMSVDLRNLYISIKSAMHSNVKRPYRLLDNVKIGSRSPMDVMPVQQQQTGKDSCLTIRISYCVHYHQ